jgi:hypothetical protein
MKTNHINELVKITGVLEDIVMHSEDMSRSEIDVRLSGLYQRMTTTVGAIQLEHDEMSGDIE